MATGPSPAVRAMVLERDGYRCLRCNMDCNITGGEIHHRCPRRMGGSKHPLINSPANLVLLCPACHLWVERNRTAAAISGWLLSNADAAVVMAVYPMRGWPWLLTTGGTRDRLGSGRSAS